MDRVLVTMWEIGDGYRTSLAEIWVTGGIWVAAWFPGSADLLKYESFVCGD